MKNGVKNEEISAPFYSLRGLGTLGVPRTYTGRNGSDKGATSDQLSCTPEEDKGEVTRGVLTSDARRKRGPRVSHPKRAVISKRRSGLSHVIDRATDFANCILDL